MDTHDLICLRPHAAGERVSPGRPVKQSVIKQKTNIFRWRKCVARLGVVQSLYKDSVTEKTGFASKKWL